jgi:hypothetical protein
MWWKPRNPVPREVIEVSLMVTRVRLSKKALSRFIALNI